MGHYVLPVNFRECNQGEREPGNADFDYDNMSDEDTEGAKEKRFFILPRAGMLVAAGRSSAA